MTLHLADVMHQAEQHPLPVDLGAASQTEAVESMRVPNIGKHRFDRA